MGSYQQHTNNNTNERLAAEQQELIGFYLNSIKQHYGCLPTNSNGIQPSDAELAGAADYLLAVTDNNRNTSTVKANWRPDSGGHLSKTVMDPSWAKWLDVKRMGLLFFLLACLLSVYLILTLPSEQRPVKPELIKRHLRMVSVFQRHGDRSGAPSDKPPKGDRHAERRDFFWPNGLGNLTEVGRVRQLLVGRELRRIYQGYLDYNTSNVLVLSSSFYRCYESAEFLLRGLFGIDQTKSAGLASLRAWHQCQVSPHSCSGPPEGSGGANDWRKVKINTDLVPWLDYRALDECAFFKAHRSPLDKDLMLDPDIESLPGIDRLQRILRERYNQELDFYALGLWSNIANELMLVHTTETWPLTQHYAEWVELPISGNLSANGALAAPGEPTMLDLYEQMAVLGYEKRIQGEIRYIQIGTLLASLIEGQKVALGRESKINSTRLANYKDKKMIIYISHDSILQGLLNSLGVIELNYPNSTFESRFKRWRKKGDVLDAFLSGLHMASFGLSIRFELIELKATSASNSTHGFSIVELHIYNAEDALYHGVHYKPIEFGSTCRRMFKRRYPKEKLDQFYKQDQFPIDKKRSCPFELMLNITANQVADDGKIGELCHA